MILALILRENHSKTFCNVLLGRQSTNAHLKELKCCISALDYGTCCIYIISMLFKGFYKEASELLNESSNYFSASVISS